MKRINFIKKILQLLILFLGVSQSQLKAQGTFDNSSLVIIWKTDNPGTSDSSSITIPLIPNHDFGYDVDWDNDGVFDEFDIAGTITHDFGAPGTYTIRIRSEFIFLYFNNEGDKEKIIDIAQWGDIKWHNFYKAFHGCSNLNISATDAPVFPSGASFASSFSNCTSLNSSLDHWDVSNVTTFYRTFAGCTNFNQPLNNWDVSSAAGFERTFENCINFNQPLDQWDVSNAIGFGGTFYGCASFNQPLHTWDVSSVKNMKLMFTKASSFNQDIGNWDVSNVTNMAIMFHKATSFNQDISNWDVGNVADMNSMFKTATVFNQDIGNWDVSKVTKMNWMFAGAKAFNQDIGNWDVSNVTNMNWMFFYADSFNQDVGNWDVGNVQHMQNMFKGPNNQFNQDIGNWDVSNVIDMNSMFEANPSFDQNIGNWDVSNVVTMERMFNLAKLSTPNYDSLLIGWNSQVLQDSVRFHGGYSIYCKGYAARANMISSNYWEIKDGGSEKNAPVVICKDITIELDENGYAEITADVFDDGSYDDCTDLLFTINKTTFDCSDIGTQPNTLIVEDANGNIDSCMVSLTILDTPFNFSCPSDITVNANHEGCSGKVNWVAPQETCTNSITSNYESGSIFPLGTTEVIYQTTDESSNVETCSFTITVVNNLDLEINNIIHPDCFGSQNGQVVITPSNGVAPYSYDWSNDGINDFDDPQNPDNLGVGNYNVVIKDSVGCTTNDSVELLPFQISISNCPQDITVSARHEDCTALVTWDIPVENCSGTELLSDFESGDQFDLGTTTVNYSTSNIFGNTATCNFDITVVNDLQSTTDNIKHPSCYSSSDGEIRISAHGGEAPYQIDWNQQLVQDNFLISGLDGGIYSFQLTDKNGCTHNDSVELIQPEELELDLLLVNASSPQINELNLVVTGGTPPYQYDWSDDGIGDFDDMEDISTIQGGTFTVVVKDSFDCTASIEITIDGIDLSCDLDEVTVFPNPSNGEFTVKLKECLHNAEIDIIDLLGRKVNKKVASSDHEIFFNLERPASGTYFIRISNNTGVIIKPLEILKDY